MLLCLEGNRSSMAMDDTKVFNAFYHFRYGSKFWFERAGGHSLGLLAVDTEPSSSPSILSSCKVVALCLRSLLVVSTSLQWSCVRWTRVGACSRQVFICSIYVYPLAMSCCSSQQTLHLHPLQV
mmetsp:Transcript_29991/g.46783  ORF Transcript_29991/g.46783 Transcript_29991/m.46783 type:complete len:124 (-) Transcript_29991:161-532(-)